jgi:hypothetical protein
MINPSCGDIFSVGGTFRTGDRYVVDLVYECKGSTVSMRLKENGYAEHTAMVGGMIGGEHLSSTFSWDAQFRPDGSQAHLGALCYSNPPGKYVHLNRMAVAQR